MFGEYGFKNLHRNTREKSKLNLNSLKINQQNVQLVLLHSNIKLNVECQRLQPTRSLVNKKQIVIFVTRATRAFLVETAQVLEAEPLGEARDARRDKKPFARVPKVILCVSMLKS